MKVNIKYETRKYPKWGFRSRFENKVNAMCVQMRVDRLYKKLKGN